MANITLKDGSSRQVADGSSILDLARGISPRLADKAIGAFLDDQPVDLSRSLSGDHSLRILTEDDAESLEMLRHSSAHILAQAMRRIYGNAVQYTIGPVVEDRFYYDFQLPVSLSSEDLPRIEAEMKKIAAEKHAFIRRDVACDVARAEMKSRGQIFKDEIISELEHQGEKTVSLYEQGDFLDLCRGPHIPTTGRLKAIKLLSVAGAYWRGDATKPMLTRIYGTAFFSQKDLDQYLFIQEEKLKRDHRRIGPQLGLFHQQEDAPGTVFWHDHGWTLWRNVENYVRAKLRENNYIEVRTPQILDRSLWEKSGHWEKYADLMFVTESEKRVFAVKPMNCPCHIQIFNQGMRSYRDLPLRMAEFGACHRNEPSGTLHGIMRVRAFTQDDAHIFCTEAQIAPEVCDFVRLLKEVYADFGFEKIIVKLATRPEKRLGTDAMWDYTEKALAAAMDSTGLSYDINPGEGAFYGPKLEFNIADALGRLWQLGTIQVDANLPERLGARYIGEDNAEHIPYMLHRAILGSMERFLGILIEHYAGAFPLWLAPRHVEVLPISEKFSTQAQALVDNLTKRGLRVTANLSGEKIGAKIREATLRKTPYMTILGAKEVEANTVSVRSLTKGDVGSMSLDEFAARLAAEIASKGRS